MSDEQATSPNASDDDNGLPVLPVVTVNPHEVWRAMSEEDRTAFGVAGLMVIFSAIAGDQTDDFHPADNEIESDGFARMEEIAERHSAENTITRIDPASVGVRVCHACGCTDSHACDGGCYWLPDEPDLCSACAGRGR